MRSRLVFGPRTKNRPLEADGRMETYSPKAPAVRSSRTTCFDLRYLAVGQNRWYHFGVGAPPILIYLSGDWDVLRGYGILTPGHLPSQFVGALF